MVMMQEEGAALPPFVAQGLKASVDYMATGVLKEGHLDQVFDAIADGSHKNQALVAAMKLMEKHGVELSPEEEKELSEMPETAMIEALVKKMPSQSKEEFQHFFLQLQMIVSTVQRVRVALQTGSALEIEAAMLAAEESGLVQYVAKMAIVQAGCEVVSMKRQHECWVKEQEARMARLIRGQGDAMAAQKRLAAAKAQLGMYQRNAADKSKKTLLTLAGGNSKAMLSGVFAAWAQESKAGKRENGIFEEYRERLERAQVRIMEARESRLKGVRGVMNRKAESRERSLIVEIFSAFREIAELEKDKRATAGEVAAMEERMKELSAQSSQNAQKLMSRMSSGSDASLVSMCWQAWLGFSKEYKKDKELNDQVKATEQRIAANMKGKSGKAKGIMDKMGQASSTALLQQVIQAWEQICADERKANEMAKLLNDAGSKFSSFQSKNAKTARSAMDKAAMERTNALLIPIFMEWKKETILEGIKHSHLAQVEGKKKQLTQVQHMFRSFASELETNLRTHADSDRDKEAMYQPRTRKPLSKSEGSVSLPDIHAKQSHRSKVEGSGSRRG